MYFRKVISDYLAHHFVYAEGFTFLIGDWGVVIFIEVLQSHCFSFVCMVVMIYYVNLLLAFAHEQLNKTVTKCL